MIHPKLHYKIIVLTLCAALVFAGIFSSCSITGDIDDRSSNISQEGDSSSESSYVSLPESSSEAAPESSLPEKDNVCTENCAQNIAPNAVITKGTEKLTDKDPKTSITFAADENGTVISLTWDTPISVDRIVIREDGENITEFAINITGADGKALKNYVQDECGPSRVAAIALENVNNLEFVFFSSGSEFTLCEIEVYSEKKLDLSTFICSAYIPTNSAINTDALTTALNALDDVTLISGAYWDESGKICVTDGFEGHYNKLQPFTAQNGGELALSATVYPAFRMTKAGTAGDTIDTKEKREVLIGEIIAFAEKYNLQGIDFDWEFPKNEAEWEYFSLLITELKAADSTLIISAAFYPGKGELSREAFTAIDRVNIMAYDQFDKNGCHSTYKTACTATESYDYFIEKGCAAYKLFIGIPCYGRPFDGSNIWNLYSDTAIPDAYTNIFNGSYYNSQALAADKAAYALQQGYGGIFLYHLKCDKPMENELSLLKGITDYLSF